jgi:hypothetical protein
MLGVGLLACVSIAGGCDTARKSVRIRTYPDDFNHLTGAELRTTMGQLAAAIGELEAQLAADETPEPAALTPVLARIESQARHLERGNAGSIHPNMDEPLDDLLARVDRAQHDLQRQPPEYEEVESLPTACTNCHVRR